MVRGGPPLVDVEQPQLRHAVEVVGGQGSRDLDSSGRLVAPDPVGTAGETVEGAAHRVVQGGDGGDVAVALGEGGGSGFQGGRLLR